METERAHLEEVQEQAEVWVEAAAEAECLPAEALAEAGAETGPARAREEIVSAQAAEQKQLMGQEFLAILSIVLNVEQKWFGGDSCKRNC